MAHPSALSLAGDIIVLLGPVPAAVSLARPSTVPRPLAAIIWWCVLQSVLGTLLGLLHVLRPGVIVTCEAALLVAAGLRYRPDRSKQLGRPAFPGWPPLLLLLPLAILGLFLLARCLASPVMEHDSLAYHLPYAVTWVQEGWLAPVRGLLHYPVGYYPGGWEVIAALLISPVHDDLLATVPSLLAWVAFFLAVVALGSAAQSDAPLPRPATTSRRRRTRARAEAAHWSLPPWTRPVACAGLVAALPVTLLAVATARCDLAVAALFLTAVLAALTYRRSRHPYDLALLIVALGMLPAMKPTGFAYAAVAAAVLFPWRGVVSLRHWVVLSSLATAVFLASIWYLRSMALSGNPLGVVEISLGSHAFFHGWTTPEQLGQSSLLRAFHVGSLSDWRALAVFGWPALGVGLPVVLALARPSRALLRESQYRTLCVLAAVSFVLYLLTPYSAAVRAPYRIDRAVGSQMRFALPFLGLLGALASVALERLRPAETQFAAAAFVALTGLAFLTPSFPYGVAALLLLWGLAGMALVLWPRRGWLRPAAFAAALAAAVPLLLLVGQQRHLARLSSYGPAYQYLGQLPPATRVGYLSEETPLSRYACELYGERFDLHPAYAPNDRRGAAGWRDVLRAQGIRTVAVGPYIDGVPSEIRALLEQLDRPESGFTRVGGEDPVTEILLYEVE